MIWLIGTFLSADITVYLFYIYTYVYDNNYKKC